MAKHKGLVFSAFAILGALTGYVTYMARKDAFSDETKDKYDVVLNKMRNVGNDIKRTYTSIGDEDEFISNTENLKSNAKKLAAKAGELVKSASKDIYQHAKKDVNKAVEVFNENKKSYNRTKPSTKKVKKVAAKKGTSKKK